MIDPITLSAAVSGATVAYNGIKKAIALGKDINDISGLLGSWMTAVSDVDNIHKNANNPSTIDKLFNGSIESVAIESFGSRKKLQKQREDLRNFLVGNYGTSAWDDLIKEEGRIRKVRNQAIYQREERNRQIRDYTIIGIATLIGCAAIVWIIWIITLPT